MKHYITKFLAIFAFAFFLSTMYHNLQNEFPAYLAMAYQPSIAQKVLRFHVIANSDSDIDQSVKLSVRNSIGAYLNPLLADCSTLSESIAVVSSHLSDIEAIADLTLQQNGCSYQSFAEITACDFPEKIYGEFTFPSGNYQALNITLGEGNGHNWWCVLFPNMCFRGSVYEVIEDDAKQSLRQVLSPEEYEAIIRSGDYKIRFKLLEYFEQTRYNSK